MRVRFQRAAVIEEERMSTTATFQGTLVEEAELLNCPDQKGLGSYRVLGARCRSQDCVEGGND